MTKTIGEVIRESRNTVGVSQETLVKVTNKLFGKNKVSRRHLSNVELGTKNFSLSKLYMVTTALLQLGAE